MRFGQFVEVEAALDALEPIVLAIEPSVDPGKGFFRTGHSRLQFMNVELDLRQIGMHAFQEFVDEFARNLSHSTVQPQVIDT